MKSTRELLGARIKEIRKNRDMSQEQLAEKIDVAPKHLSRIEVGRGYPSLDTLENIANELKVDMKDFFEFQHLETVDDVQRSVDELLLQAKENDKRLLLKLMRAVVR